MPARNYRDLLVWQRSMDLVEAVYRMTRAFPKEELYGLAMQMRRAAVSVPSNIAKGQGRGDGKEFPRFLRISYGSLREIETQAMLAVRLGLAADSEANMVPEIAEAVGRMLNGLMKSQSR